MRVLVSKFIYAKKDRNGPPSNAFLPRSQDATMLFAPSGAGSDIMKLTPYGVIEQERVS